MSPLFVTRLTRNGRWQHVRWQYGQEVRRGGRDGKKKVTGGFGGNAAIQTYRQQARRVAQAGRQRAHGGRDGQVFSPVCKHTQGRNWDPPAQVGAGTSAAPGLSFFFPCTSLSTDTAAGDHHDRPAGEVRTVSSTRWRTVGIAGIFARGLLGGRGG